MAGLGIRLFTDEMIDPVVAAELRRLGYDVVSCHEVGRAGRHVPDHAHLEYAAADGRAVLTSDVSDYQALDATWRAAGRTHAGIILSLERKQPGRLLRAIRRHLDTMEPATQYNLVLWLPSHD